MSTLGCPSGDNETSLCTPTSVSHSLDAGCPWGAGVILGKAAPGIAPFGQDSAQRRIQLGVISSQHSSQEKECFGPEGSIWASGDRGGNPRTTT